MSPKDQKLELLASVRLFGRCGSKEIQRLGELTDVMDLPAGRVLMRQGETGQEMMIIVDGRAAIEKDDHREFHALMDEMPSVRAQVMEAPALALMAAETPPAR